MVDINLVKQMRHDSKDFDALYKNEEDSRHNYDEFVLGVTQKMWDKPLKNGKRFDANASLALYELSLSIDQRVIQQAVEQSYLRSSFENKKGIKLFDEYTGIEPSAVVYMPTQLEISGFDSTATNKSSKIKPSTNPNEIKTIKASVSPLRRPIFQFQEGFELTLGDLELASFRNIPLQDMLTTRVARDLMMEEQDFAFNYLAPGTYVSPEENGLFNNTAISTAITWTAGALLAAGTTGRAIVDEFVRIQGRIQDVTKAVFKGLNQPLCIITSVANVNALMRTFSDLEGRDALSYLSDRGFNIAGLPVLGNNQSFFYYKDFENIEISTSRMVEAQPQSYTAKTTSWFFPYRNVTAGLTVKRKESIYSVAGMNP